MLDVTYGVDLTFELKVAAVVLKCLTHLSFYTISINVLLYLNSGRRTIIVPLCDFMRGLYSVVHCNVYGAINNFKKFEVYWIHITC